MQAARERETCMYRGTSPYFSRERFRKTSSMQMLLTFKENGVPQEMPFTQMIMSQNMSYSDFNGKIVIQLPEEAKNAKVMPVPTNK
jgi:hypothetical protein